MSSGRALLEEAGLGWELLPVPLQRRCRGPTTFRAAHENAATAISRARKGTSNRISLLLQRAVYFLCQAVDEVLPLDAPFRTYSWRKLIDV